MREKTLTLQNVTIVVREADLRAGFLRGRLQGELVYEPGLDKEDPDLANVYAVYADLVAATKSVQGMDWPMEPEAFVSLSDLWFDQVGMPWLRTVRELNPHWAPGYTPEGEASGAVG